MRIVKTISIVFLLLFTCFNLSAQYDKLVYVGAHVSLKNTVYKYEDPSLTEAQNSFNYAVGIDLYHPITEKVELRFGVTYNIMNIKQVDYSVSFGCDQAAVGTVDPYNSFIRDDYQFHYAGVPLMTKVKLFGKENYIYVIGGVELLFKVKDKRDREVFECGDLTTVAMSDNTSRNSKKTVCKFTGGIGVEILFTKQMVFVFEPRIEYTGNYMLKANNVHVSPYNKVKALDQG